MESWSRRWSRSYTGDRPILWIGVFWHCKIARATLSLSKEPWGPVFPFTILFAVFTASSAWTLDWRYATKDSLCLTHHILRNSWNALEVKGKPPLVLSSSGAPYVLNGCWQMDINLVVVVWPGSRWYKMSQPVNLSVKARYVWSPVWKRSMTICWNGQSGDHVKMIGSCGWQEAMFEHTMQFALILISFSYCGLPWPAAWIRSGDIMAILLLPANVAIKAVDFIILLILLYSCISNWDGFAENTLRRACTIVTGWQETASEPLCHFLGQCWMVNWYHRVFSFSWNSPGFWSLDAPLTCRISCVGGITECAPVS